MFEITKYYISSKVLRNQIRKIDWLKDAKFGSSVRIRQLIVKVQKSFPHSCRVAVKTVYKILFRTLKLCHSVTR